MLPMLFLITSLLLSSQQAWVWSVHPESGFKILSPAVLTHQQTEVPTPTDVIQYHQYNGGSIADTTMGLAFVIDHYILPPQDHESDPGYQKEFFETTVDQILLSVDGVLVYSDYIHESGRDQYIWKATYLGEAGVIRGLCILSGGNYYGLQVFGWKKNKPDVLMSKFLDSFKILENKN